MQHKVLYIIKISAALLKNPQPNNPHTRLTESVYDFHAGTEQTKETHHDSYEFIMRKHQRRIKYEGSQEQKYKKIKQLNKNIKSNCKNILNN